MTNETKSALTFIIDDPAQLNAGNPKTINTVFVTLNRDYNEIINDKSKPTSECLNDAIIEVTANKETGRHLGNEHGGFIEFSCANCGGGLRLTSCSSCEHEFKDDYCRSGWHTPLPNKVVELLIKEGHTFKADPLIAVKKEQTLFDARQK